MGSPSAEVATQIPNPAIHRHINIITCDSVDPIASVHRIEQTDLEASEASVIEKDGLIEEDGFANPSFSIAGEIPVRRGPGLASQASTFSTIAMSESVLTARPLAFGAATEEGKELEHLLLRLSAFSHSWYSRLVHSLRSTTA